MKPLTKRERQIAALLVRELLSAPEIANRLSPRPSPRTIDVHIQHIAAKLGHVKGSCRRTILRHFRDHPDHLAA